MVDQRGGGRLAVGAGDPDDLVRRQIGARLREQLDIADDRDASFARLRCDRMAVERHAGRDDDAGETGQVDRPADRSSPRCVASQTSSRLDALDYSLNDASSFESHADHLGPARQQRVDRRRARPRQPQHRIAFAAPGRARDHRSFSVDSPASASTNAMIQKRITTVGSAQPSCSKWWWIGAILNTRLPVRL